MPSLLSLPADCILNIFTRLPVVDVVSTACCCSVLRQLGKDDCFWADLAEAKWGQAVRHLTMASEQEQAADAAGASSREASHLPASVQAGKWQRYCYHRMSGRTISCSPVNLLQESYPDPWQHIVCCVLCSRTSGSELIRTSIAAFFEALPTPSAVLAAEDGLLRDLLHPLGLQASRMAAVKSVSHNFLATDWQTPAEFHGCGKFVEDSWRIFCKGDRDSRNVADVNLKAYLAWVNRQACKLSDVPSERQRKQRTRKQQQQKRPQQPASRVSSRQHCRAAHDDQAQATLATAVRTRAAANKAVNAKGGPVCSAAVGCHSRRRVTRPAEPDRVSRTAVGQSGHEHRKQNQLHKGSRAQQLQAAF